MTACPTARIITAMVGNVTSKKLMTDRYYMRERLELSEFGY